MPDRDERERRIVEALERFRRPVHRLNPGLLVGAGRGRLVILDIDGDESVAAKWRGYPVHTVTTAEEALEAVCRGGVA